MYNFELKFPLILKDVDVVPINEWQWRKDSPKATTSLQQTLCPTITYIPAENQSQNRQHGNHNCPTIEDEGKEVAVVAEAQWMSSARWLSPLK